MARRSIIATLFLVLSAVAHGQGYFNLFQPPPSPGVMKGSPDTYITSNAAASDVISLFNKSSTCTDPTTDFLRADGTCAVPAGSGSGTVTSVNYTVPSSLFSCTGVPITGSGTIACSYATGQTATELFGTDGSGNVSLFALTGAYVPPINLASTSNGGITNTLGTAHGGSGLVTATAHGVLLGEGTSPFGSVAAMALDTLLQGQGTGVDPAAVSVPNCGSGTQALSYSTSTHTFGCQTISAGTGTVTSVGLTAPSVFSISGSPVTSTGTLALTFAGAQTANQILATPSGTTGALGLRSLVLADIPAINLAGSGNGGVTGTLGVTSGGEGLATATLGDIRYGSGTNTISALAGNTTTTKKFLTQMGTGTVSAAPAWGTVSSGDVSGLAASATTDTTNASNISSGTLALGRLPTQTGTGNIVLSASPALTGSPTVGGQNICLANGTNCPGPASYKFASGVITISGVTCTLVQSQGNVSSCTGSGTGLAQVNFSPAFTAGTCVADAVDTSPVPIALNPGSSITGSANFTLRNTSSALVNGSLSFVCFGT